MNWGRKLILVFIAFAALMSTLVYKCMKENFELVSKDYYSEELRYQDKIDGTHRASKLSELQIRQNNENVVIQLPEEMNGLSVKGDVTFYCADDSKKDRKIELLNVEEGKQFISKSELAKAKYLVKVNWYSGADNYYIEKQLTVN